MKTLQPILLATITGILFWSSLSIARADAPDQWDTQNSGVTNMLNAVAFGNGIWVAAGGQGTIVNSYDGVVWTRGTSGTTAFLNSVVFANGTFVIVGEFGTILTSTNGTNWSSRTSGTSDYLYDVSFGMGAFIAVSDTGTVLTSTNGTTWTTRSGTSGVYGVAYGNGKFAAVGGGTHCHADICEYFGILSSSADGVAWNQSASLSMSYLSDLAFGNGTFVAVGGDLSYSGSVTASALLTSTDGVTWTKRSVGSSAFLYNVAFGDGRFAVVGDRGVILTSTNGVDWTRPTSSSFTGLFNVGYGAGRFIAVGDAGTILRSGPPPVLTVTRQPVDQTVSPGGSVTLSAAAEGPNPPSFQWQLEGANILDATNASYSFSGASIANHGNYRVLITDGVSSVMSSNALVYVLVRPGIITQPVGVTNLQGNTVSFSVIATGAPPLNYRWTRQGVTYLSNAPSTLVISNIQPSLAGSFRVFVENRAGLTFSLPANLQVIADSDVDGLPDSWELSYFGNSTSASAIEDTDGDGMSNRDEYLAGTDPTNRLSVLKLTIASTNAGVLQFVAQTNVGYVLQYRTNLTSAFWSNLTTIPAQAQVRTMQVNVPNPPPEKERYYRIVTQPVP